MRINNITDTMDMFVYGKSGAGKDTISNYMRDWHSYRKMRLADTIKRIICEIHNISFEQLEELKRTDEFYRKEHYRIGELINGSKTSLNRLEQIINRTSYDFNDNREVMLNTPIIITDCRSYQEAKIMLDAGFVGIFLSRLTKEYNPETNNHWSEQNMFFNNELINLINENDNVDRCVVIFNGNNELDFNEKNYHGGFKQVLNDFTEKTDLTEYGNLLVINNASANKLVESIDTFLPKYKEFLKNFND